MSVPQPRPRRRKPLDAGPFWPEIGSFRLHLAAEGKAAKTVRSQPSHTLGRQPYPHHEHRQQPGTVSQASTNTRLPA
jgi:hypothetical protein